MDVHESTGVKTRASRKRSFAVVDSDLPQDNSDSVLESPSSTDCKHEDFIPRSYQTEVFQVARKRNTIAVMETGSGKTMIAVMLISELGLATKSSGEKKKLIFLAPTVHLVHQQFKVIKIHTNFEVGEYYGAKGVDEWRAECWDKEINEHDVLVMTPQILLDALRKAFLSLEKVCLMIIDECHRASGNHPYTKIMKEFYYKTKDKPKIFGMTASPVVRKGVSSSMDCENQISNLESILDSQIYTIEDKKELEVYVPSARETYIFYEQAESRSLDLKASIEALWFKNEASLSKLHDVVRSRYKDLDDKFKTLRKRLSNDHSTILYCLHELGVICAYEAVQVCLEGARTAIEECEIYSQSLALYKDYLEEVSSIIGESYALGMEKVAKFGLVGLKESKNYSIEVSYGKESVFSFGHDYSVDSRYISPKLFSLLQLFKSFGESRQVLCLIFVERIVAARVIKQLVTKVTDLSHFTSSYLTGCNASTGAPPSKMQETLESFCYGKVNLLFATDVVEEGIHVPQCSCVVRFNLPKTVRGYVQSRGRARQDNSQYVIMLERGNMKHRGQLFDLIKSEHSMMDAAMSRDQDTWILKPCSPEVKNVYVADASGASVTADSSVSLIHLYCQKLPGDKYFTPKPIFQIYEVQGSYACKLTLPPNAPFQTIVGPSCRSSHLSKQLACLEACKRLHEVGGLDDHFLPCMGDSSKFDVIEKPAKLSGAGSKKRKELHGTTQIHALSRTWGENLDGAIFHAYKFSFSCNVVGEFYSGFVLLLQSKLDDDVGNIELELYLVSKIVKASVLSRGEFHMSAEQIIKSKAFQEIFFTGMFGRLFAGSKTAGTQREFLLQNETQSLWKPYYSYFLLPLQRLNVANVDSWEIDWTGISSCASIIEFFRKNSLLGTDNFCGGKVNLENSDLAEKDCNVSPVISFANCNVAIEGMKDMVVLAIHTGRIYSIVEAVRGTSAESTFDGKLDGTPSEYTTFSDYFNKKYGIVLKYPKQPLVRLKQSHNPHNLLVNFNDIGDEKLKSDMVPRKPQMHVNMPPELLFRIDIPREVLKSSYLLPSLMHRLESLMLSSQLRKEIGGHASSFKISSHLILEALTTLRCCESFSLERLELLGDSVLKYAVSCHLYLKHFKKHEGQLSGLRQLAVSNATLHKLGTNRNLQGYIRDSPFDPRRWCAPGQRRIRHVPCKCEVDTLEVPIDSKFLVEDPKVVLGICCDKGHRWMISKTIADGVESLIGAYYIDGGLIAALQVMKWFGIDAEIDPPLLFDAIATATLRSYIPKMDDIATLESKIGYQFVSKGLLLEAITHATEEEPSLGYCYQRLEFLGDSVLDLLITRHLFHNYRDIDPGEMTDLRSASVSNENFAQVAVRHNFQPHLQHCSSLLLSQITEYVTHLSESHGGARTHHGSKVPKVLGDLVESIAGAILIDTKLNLDEVWRIYKPLLSPIVTPDKLELPPLRELNELCDSLGYFVNEKCTRKGEFVRAELRLQLNDILLIGEGYERSRKLAKGGAASRLLVELQKRGILFSYGSKKRKIYEDVDGPPLQEMKNDISGQKTNGVFLELNGEENHTTTEIQPPARPTAVDCERESSCSIPAVPINMKKGGPRNSLFKLCRSLDWPMPTFRSSEHRSRTPIEFDEGSEKRKGYNSFQSNVILHIPNCGSIDCEGDAKADKKSSLDSAAVALLHELHRRGKIIVGDP